MMLSSTIARPSVDAVLGTSMIKINPSELRRFGLAILGVVLAVIARLALDPVLGDLVPYATLFLAILVVAGFVGRGPAILATLLGAIVATRFLVAQRDRFTVDRFDDWVAMALYLAVGLGIALIGGAMRNARGRAEASLAERLRQEERSEITLSSLGEAVVTVDTEARVVSMNPIAESLTGWSAAEAVGRPIGEVYQVVGEKSGLSAASPVEEIFRTGSIAQADDRKLLVARDGKTWPIDENAAPIRDRQGAIRGVVLVFRDDTARRLSEWELKENQARKEAILRSALDCIITIDHEGRIVEFNPAAEATFGHRRADVMGRGMGELIIPTSLRPAHRGDMAHFLGSGEGSILGRRIEVPAIRADGSEFPVELAVTRISTEGPPMFTAYLREISDRKRAEATIAEQVRLAEYGLRIGLALTRSSTLSDMLGRCAQVTVDQLDGAFARIWTVNPSGDVLELQASAGMYTHLDGDHGRIPVGRFKIGRIAWERRPHMTNSVVGDPQVPSQDWARREGMVAFAGYPLVVDDRLVGVLGMFARHPLSDAEVAMMGSVANEIALGIERKRGEESLHRHQEWLQVTLASIGDAVIATDTEDRVTFLNKVAEPLTGWSAAEAVGVPLEQVFRVVEEVTRRPVENPATQALRSGEVVSLPDQTILIARDGSERPIEDTASPIRDREGLIVGVVLVFRDATGRQDSERTLRESEARFRHLAGAMPQIVFVNRPDRSIEYFNQRWFDHTGLSAEESYRPDGWQRAIHPEDIPAIVDEATRSDESGQPFEAEFRLQDRSGSYRWHLGRSVPVFDESGRLLRRFGTATDIDDRKRAEDAARFLAEASAALAGIVDESATLQEVARLAVPSFADWCTVDLSGAHGRPRRLAVAHADPSRVAMVLELDRRYPPDPDGPTALAQVLRSGESFLLPEITPERLKASARDADHLAILGDLGLRSYLCVPLKGRTGTLGAISFVAAESGRCYGFDDLRLAEDLGRRAAIALENARLNFALKDADRRKDEFLATLAHELRNPLAPIRNTLHLMKAEPDGVDFEAERAMAERHVVHLARLIDDLMDVARISQGKIEIRKEVVELAIVVDQAVRASRPQVENRRHELTIDLPDETIRLVADPTRLEQILWNLLNNAAKYTEPGGTIRLSASRDGDDVMIRVRDDGIGIAPEMLAKVFEMFVQIGEHLEHAQGGLGIGLSLVRSLVEIHGGTIVARSEGAGRGSEFLVRLPALAASESAPAEPRVRAVGIGPGRHRILIVDDNTDAARSLSRLLTRVHDQEVQVAHDGPEALKIADEFLPEVILLDIGLPGMSGYEVAEVLRSRPAFANTLIVALTGWGQEEDRRRSTESGIDRHLVKPVDPDAIVHLLESSSPGPA